jgi:hypothetical protein
MQYSSYIVKQFDNLRKISQTLLGDIHKWQELADLNALDYPFISDLPVEGRRTLQPGDTLIYPDPKVSTDEVGAQLRTYGTDLLLIDGLPVPRGNSISMIKGSSVVQQSVGLLLGTNVGGVPAHQWRGIYVKPYLGLDQTELNLQRINLEAEKCVRQNPHVEDVTVTLVSNDEERQVIDVKYRLKGLQDVYASKTLY